VFAILTLVSAAMNGSLLNGAGHVRREPKGETFVQCMLHERHLRRYRAIRRTGQILLLAASLTSFSVWAQISPCDLNSDGVVTTADVQLAINMSVGSISCTANVVAPGVCNLVVVQRVVNAALGQACVTGSVHSATLTWVASTSANVAGYNVYRGTVSGGPYTLLNASPTSAVTYADTTVQAGQTYYFVVKAVGSDGSLSIASNEAPATIPTP
jgi:hypothetical protein